MQGIKISISKVGAIQDITLITIAGYIDTTTCRELTRTIQEIMSQGQYLIVADLAGVSYVSSAGWGVFMGEIKNIRDKGGDLKIVQMNAEVFEVFEMLEFTKILNYYDTIEEAIDEFDIMRGVDITVSKTPLQEGSTAAGEDGPASAAVPGQALRMQNPGKDDADIPLVEKIKRIVVESPLEGARQIRKKLNTEKYGFTKVTWLRIRKILRELNLETKDKRYRYYRSR